MALPDTRYRVRYLFLAVMVGHILIISTQVTSKAGVSLLQAGLSASVSELQRLSWAGVSAVYDVWRGYVALRGVHAENQRLTREVEDLRVKVQEERAAAQTAETLRALLDLRARQPWRTVAADVIGGPVSQEFRSILIDRGEDAGFRRDMAVITGTGVVGRVSYAGLHSSTVQLIIDKNAAAAAMVESSRSQGVIGMRDDSLRLDYLSSSAKVEVGDRVVTAGVDGMYPAGLLIGLVTRVDWSRRIVVLQPAADFSRLEHVLVVVDPVPQPPSNRAVPDGAAVKTP